MIRNLIFWSWFPSALGYSLNTQFFSLYTRCTWLKFNQINYMINLWFQSSNPLYLRGLGFLWHLDLKFILLLEHWTVRSVPHTTIVSALTICNKKKNYTEMFFFLQWTTHSAICTIAHREICKAENI